MQSALHIAVGRPGSDVRRRRLLTFAVTAPLAVGVVIGTVTPIEGPGWWVLGLASMLVLLAAAEAGNRATEVPE